jgi:hypothetical protein
VCAIALLLSPFQPAFGATSESESKSVGSGGPDVLGLRIGMTLAEARAIFKSRILVPDKYRKGYTETPSSLMIRLPNGLSGGLVPSGNYIDRIEAGWQGDGYSLHNFVVHFTPVPGHQEIVSLARLEELKSSTKPTFDAFEKTLLGKYGTPTHSDQVSGALFNYYWSYDSNGTLQKPGSIKDIPRCQSKVSMRGSTFGVLNRLGDQQFEQFPAQCGAIFLHVYGRFDGNTYHGRDTLVDLYEVYMTGFDTTLRAHDTANAIIDKASADASAAAIQKGQQQKPEF